MFQVDFAMPLHTAAPDSPRRSVTGTADYVLGADATGVLLLPAGDAWLLVDSAALERVLERPDAKGLTIAMFAKSAVKVVSEGPIGAGMEEHPAPASPTASTARALTIVARISGTHLR